MRIFHEHKIKEQLKIFCSHRKKRMKQLQKKIKRGKLDMKEDDPFELFVAATSIRYCYYAETHKILGQTFGMCILQVIEFLVHFTLKCPLCTWKTCTLFYIRKIKMLRNTSNHKSLKKKDIDYCIYLNFNGFELKMHRPFCSVIYYKLFFRILKPWPLTF